MKAERVGQYAIARIALLMAGSWSKYQKLGLKIFQVKHFCIVVAKPASSNELPHSCYNNSLTSPFVKSCVADSCSFKGPLFASSIGKVETRPPFILSRSKTSSVKETEKAVSIEPIYDNTIQLIALKKFCFHRSDIL